MARASLVRFALTACVALVGAVCGRATLWAQQTPNDPTTRGPVMSFALESSAGGRTSIASARGKVVVIFYEDRDHRDDNAELKGVLQRFVAGNEIRAELMIVPVANVSGLDFPPASTFARAAVRAVATEIGMPVLLDWRRTLQAAPISLRDGASNVLVLDRTGHVVFRYTGAVTGAARSQFFRAVRRAIRDRDGDGEPDAPASPLAPAARGAPAASPR